MSQAQYTTTPPLPPGYAIVADGDMYWGVNSQMWFYVSTGDDIFYSGTVYARPKEAGK